MKPRASTSLLLATAMGLGLATSGCSFIFSRGPDVAPTRTSQGRPGTCSGSVVAPVFDTVFTASYLVGGISALRLPEGGSGGSSTVRSAVLATNFGFAGLHLLSAIYGYSASASCREAKARDFVVVQPLSPLAAYVASDREAKARATPAKAEVVGPTRQEAFWKAWLAQHEETACIDALQALKDDPDCVGAACRAPLLLSSGYQASCPVDTDTTMLLYRARRRWETAAGTATSGCLEETYLALTDPAKAAALPKRCSGQGKTEAALREAVRYHPAEPARSAPAPAEQQP
jgi:hypothetical protein